MKRRSWSSVEELFEALNQNCNYLILRNFEGIEKKEILLEAHPDIDLLCDDPHKLKKQLRIVRTPGHIRHYDHYYVRIGQQLVEIGVRYVGERYYDTEWQKNMLCTKVFHSGGFYVMNQENYFYSLIYHAFYQKKKVSEDYGKRFIDMAAALGGQITTENELLSELSCYMKEKGYFVTCPKDVTIPMQFKKIPAEMLLGIRDWKRRKILHFPQKVVRVIKRRLIKS